MLFLDVFKSFGVDFFTLTITDAENRKTAFRRSASQAALRNGMAELLRRARKNHRNVIVRPHDHWRRFLQLDDLDPRKMERVKPLSFLILRTSGGSYQAWLAIEGLTERIARAVRREIGSDPTASGATRIAGSRNWKAKYHPNYPFVEIVHVAPGLVFTVASLEADGLVVAEEQRPTQPRPPRASPKPGGPRRFPDYQRALANAPKVKDGSRPDRSKADFFWCYLAAKWGWSAEEIVAELLRVSEKAQESGERYAMATVVKVIVNVGSSGGRQGL